METWQLRIMVEGIDTMVCGTEEVLRDAYNEWCAHVKEPNGMEGLWEVIGHCDSADRAECRVALRISEIKGLSLVRLY